MEYIKFNCYDMAAQTVELRGTHRKLQNLAEELSRVLNSLDPQIKSYENMQSQFAAVGMAAADIAERILTVHNSLDQIVDLYHKAENSVMQTVEGLPTKILHKGNGRTNTSTAKIETSSISNGDLIMEDWLAEMVYKQGNK